MTVIRERPDGDTAGGSPHHANDRLYCAADGEQWPCSAWLLARNKADRSGNRQTLIEVPAPPRRKRR